MITIGFRPFKNEMAAGFAAAKRQTRAILELLPSEAGKTWRTTEEIRVEWRGKVLTVPKGFEHDRYTFAPDLPDRVPCIVHDFACGVKKWDDGSPLPRKEGNRLFLDLMKASPNRATRFWAKPYFFGVEVQRFFRILTFRGD